MASSLPNHQSLSEEKNSGWPVFWSFMAFFAVFCAVDVYFVYSALKTHSGVVTQHAYEKGLNYDDALAQARAQADMHVMAGYENGILSFALYDPQGTPVTNATVHAFFQRSVSQGHDFEIPLTQGKVAGVYTARPDVPLKGAWTVKLGASWAVDDEREPGEESAPQHYWSELPIMVQ